MTTKEKKVEAIHLRVSATSKAYLEGVANAMGKTSTRVVEDLVVAAAANLIITGVDSAVTSGLPSGSEWTLLKALQLAYIPGEPLLSKIRTYFLADEALTGKDRMFVEAILWSPEFFSGETEIFRESEQILTHPDKHRLYKVNLDAVREQSTSLNSYAGFRVKNKQMSLSYTEYLKMVNANKDSN
jgi:hypothetical protein